MWGSEPGCLYPFWLLTLAMRTKQGQRAHFCGACDLCIHPAFYAFFQVPGTLEFSTQQPKPNSSLLRLLARSVSPKVHYTSGGGITCRLRGGQRTHFWAVCARSVAFRLAQSSCENEKCLTQCLLCSECLANVISDVFLVSYQVIFSVLKERKRERKNNHENTSF